MSESGLVTFRDCSSGKWTNRGNNKVEKVILHHMAGCLTMAQMNNEVHNPNRQMSSTYAIDITSAVGQFVSEKYRPWTSGSFAADKNAVTIEIANSATGGNWPVSDANLAKTIELVADIFKRNGITPSYTGGKDGTIQYHQMWDDTECPGPYMIAHMNYICDQVKAKMGVISIPTAPNPNDISTYTDEQLADMVIQGVFGNGDVRKQKLGNRYSSVQAIVNQKMYGTYNSSSVDYNALADAVLRGDYGNGTARRTALDSKYGTGTYDKVQAIVNNRLYGNGSSSVDYNALAKAVIRGDYGNGTARKQALNSKFGAGTYEKVQAIVNKMV